MSFATKKDYCGLTTVFSTALDIRDDAENKTAQVYRPVSNEGEILAEEVYGEDSAPSNNYALKAAISASAGDLQIGTGVITTVDSKKYALESVTINTSAGSPVSISATSQELEEGATTTNAVAFAVPAFALSTRHIAQDIFSAITASANGTVTSLQCVINCTITKDSVAGTKVSSDANSGLLMITGTLLQKSTANNAAAPSITVASGFTLAAPLTRTNPESAYPEFSFTITKPLAIAS